MRASFGGFGGPSELFAVELLGRLRGSEVGARNEGERAFALHRLCERSVEELDEHAELLARRLDLGNRAAE